MIDTYTRKAVITRVIDGDTVQGIIQLGFNCMVEHRLRVLGIDCPELNATDPTQRELAIHAKDFVTKAILNRQVYITSHKSDSFGRYLATIEYQDDQGNVLDLAEELLKAGLAKEYRG